MEWTFSGVENSEETVSTYLEFYGYIGFLAPVFAALPGILFKVISKVTQDKFKGDFYGLIIIL